jgi:hypothetical protein
MASRPDHPAIEAAFHACLWSPETPEGLDPRRFSVYRNNVQRGLARALAARFPVVERLVGAAFFAALARAFAAARPPASPVLLDWGQDFAPFLAGFAPVADLPYLPDVARLEWVRGLACHAADAPMIDPGLLARADPARLVLGLAPSVRGFHSLWPVLAIWQANQPGAIPGPLPPGPCHAMIARDPGFAIVMESLAVDQHDLLARLLAGLPLAQAATTDPAPLLALLIRHRLIATCGETP